MEVQLYLGEDKPSPEWFRKVTNIPLFPKPDGGLWTSTYVNGSSDWLDWCISENFREPHKKKKFLLYPSPLAKICVIDSLSDLCKLPMQKLPPEFPKGIRKDFHSYPDFEKLQESYDGINLTRKGQFETRFSAPSLYGWDVESTLWFRWVFDKCEILNLSPEK